MFVVNEDTVYTYNVLSNNFRLQSNIEKRAARFD